MKFNQGSNVDLRIVGSAHGMLFIHPHIVIEDNGDNMILYQPEGCEILRAQMTKSIDDPSIHFEKCPSLYSQMDVLRIINFEKRYSILVVWISELGTAPYWPWFEGDQRYRGMKIDVHSLPKRTEYGLDFTDDMVDLIIKPDGHTFWKDRDGFQRLINQNVYLEKHVKEINEVCKEAEKDVEIGQFPFDGSLNNWRPSESYDTPTTDFEQAISGEPWINLSTGRLFDDRRPY